MALTLTAADLTPIVAAVLQESAIMLVEWSIQPLSAWNCSHNFMLYWQG